MLAFYKYQGHYNECRATRRQKIFMKKNTKSLWYTFNQSYNAVINILYPAINKKLLSLLFYHYPGKDFHTAAHKIWKQAVRAYLAVNMFKVLIFSICYQKVVDILKIALESPAPSNKNSCCLRNTLWGDKTSHLMSFLLVALTLLCCPAQCTWWEHDENHNVQGVMDSTW